MNDRDRQDDYGRNQQHGGNPFRGSGDYDAPRQSHQWQADHPRQANTSEWDFDAQNRVGGDDRRSYRFSGQGDPGAQGGFPSRMSDDDWRNERHDAAPYRSERADHRTRGLSGEDEWRPQHSSRRRNSQAYYSRNFDASGGNDFGNFTSEDFGGRDFYNRGSGMAGGMAGGMRSSESYRPSYGFSSWLRDDDQDRGRNSDDYGTWRHYGESRGFLQRAGDEVASWFGDEDAARRREQDHRADDHRGRGPATYKRSDERIREDANDHLTHDWRVDASNIIVSVKEGEVTLDGTVNSRQAKRRAEDCVDRISGVKHVQNNLRVQERRSDYRSGQSTEWREGDQLASSQATDSGASQATGARTTEGVGSAATAGVINASGTRSRDKTE